MMAVPARVGAIQGHAQRGSVMAVVDPQGAYVGDDGKVRFHCDSCATKLKVPPTAVGRRVKCRKCGSVLTVPDPDATPEDSGDEWGALDELAAAGGVAVEPPRPIAKPPAATASAASAPARGGAAEAAGSALAGIGATAGLFAGPLVRGTIGSAIGAALGGVIWAMIAISTHYEIGYVAVLVGAMSGMGMFIGVRDPSALGGAIAAGMAALSIVIAKASIVLYLFGDAGEIPIADLLFAIVRYSDPMDILFYILAIGAAYGAATKIAAGE
jgi:hypothetical protein